MLITRYAKIVMALSLAVFCLLVVFNNLTDYGTNFLFVKHVLSMDTTYPGNALMYRAITSPTLWHLAYATIIAAEAIAGASFSPVAFASFRRARRARLFSMRPRLSSSPRACSPSSSGASASWSWPGNGSPCGNRKRGMPRSPLSASS